MMDKEKKKRSPNFTNEEKETLLALVAKFQGVIECKKSGASYLQKKKEAWVAVTKQYNSLCTTGPRDEEMLKHFYNNVKHRARKVSASENKQRYLEEFSVNSELVSRDEEKDQKDEKLPGEPSDIAEIDHNTIILDENSIKDLKSLWADDKKNIKKTGGGSYNPILTDADHQVLAILDDQIRPDENPFDEAAEYFKDTIEELTLENPVQKYSPNNTMPKRKFINNQRCSTKTKKNPKKTVSNEYMKKSAEMLKKIYFKKKIELTFYQKKNEMLKFRNEKKNQENAQKRHEIEMQILKKQLEKVERELL